MSEVKIFRIYATPSDDSLLCTTFMAGTEDEALAAIREHELLGPQLGEGARAVESEEI
jgi:hypothetical protein